MKVGLQREGREKPHGHPVLEVGEQVGLVGERLAVRLVALLVDRPPGTVPGHPEHGGAGAIELGATQRGEQALDVGGEPGSTHVDPEGGVGPSEGQPHGSSS